MPFRGLFLKKQQNPVKANVCLDHLFCLSQTPVMAPKLTLVYLPLRARAEVARMIMAYGDIPYSDNNCRQFFGCSFLDAKTSGKLPFGQLPVLAVDDTLISQSGAINRYLAGLVSKPDFIPKDPVKAALTDAIHETAGDLVRIMPIVNIMKGDQLRQEKKEFFSKTLPAKLPALVKMLGDQSFYCGDAPTYSDFSIYSVMDLVSLYTCTVHTERITGFVSGEAGGAGGGQPTR